MTPPGQRGALCAALLALSLVPARAGAQAPPALRGLRLFLSAEGAVGSAPEHPDLAAGGRLAAGLHADGALVLGAPVEQLRVFGELEVAGGAGTARSQPRFTTRVLLGPGVAVGTSARTSAQVALLVGEHIVALHDHLRGGWVEDGSGALGVRLGLAFRPWSRGARVRYGPTAGVSLTLLWIARETDPLRNVSWGGFAPTLTLTLGADVLSPAMRLGHGG